MTRLIPRFLRVLLCPGYLEPPKKGALMLETIRQKAAEAAKAIVAAVTPIVVTLVADLMADLSAWAVAGIIAGGGAVAVWLTPNRPPAG